MSERALKAIATGKQPANDFPTMLAHYKGEIARALPRHLNGDRMARIALTAFRRNPKLGECDPKSVFAAVIQASQLGLEPDTLGRSYLIPYGKECNFVPGWKGLVELLNRSKEGTAWTGAVFDGDKFDFELGDKPYLKHKPGLVDDPLRMVYAYAIGRVRGADVPIIEAWPNDRILRHRDRYNKVGKRHYSYENWEMYARKVVLLQVLKYLPMSPELSSAVAFEYAAEQGGQGLTVEDAIANTFVPPAIEHEPAKPDQKPDPSDPFLAGLEDAPKS